MTMKVYSKLPGFSEVEPHSQMQLGVMLRTPRFWEGVLPFCSGYSQGSLTSALIALHQTTFSTEDRLRGSLDKFPDFFSMGTFFDSTHMKL